MVVGTLVLDVLLGDVASLKQKRSVLRPIVAELRRRFEVSAAETGGMDLHRRAELSVALVCSTHAHAVEVLEGCERLVADELTSPCWRPGSGCSTTTTSIDGE